jgi:hypothetical protein
MDMTRPWPDSQRPASESKEIRWTPATELLGRAMDRSMRIHDFQARNELAGLWNGKGRKLVTTP